MRLLLQERPTGREAPRFVQLQLESDLLGGWALVRETGQIGGRSTVRREQYLDDVGRPQKEAPLMTWSDLYPTALSYARASYPKMATNLVALR